MEQSANDEDLRELMGWATNIVRLPLPRGAFKRLATQVREFPPDFLLSGPHVRYLTLECDGEAPREFTLLSQWRGTSLCGWPVMWSPEAWRLP